MKVLIDKMRFIDFFSGIGGFRIGMERGGHECVGFCEVDKFAVASYTYMHLLTEKQREYLNTLTLRQRQKEILKEKYRNGEWYANDITKVTPEELPEADCYCFGFPCQSFSIAGKRGGFEDTRGTLFFEVMRLAKARKPKLLFAENVKGLLSHDRGRTFGVIINTMDELGYDVSWQVLNSKDFGVPQNRERVFLVGHLRETGAKEIFPVWGTTPENSVQIIEHNKDYRRNLQTFDPEGITEALDTGQGGGRGHHVTFPVFCDMNYGAGIKLTKHARTLQARYNKGVNNRPAEISGVAVPVLTPERLNKRQKMFTSTSQDQHGVAIGMAVRKRDTGMVMEDNGTEQSNALTSNCKHHLVGIIDPHENQPQEKTDSDYEDVIDAVWCDKYQSYIAIRKLTPRECFRLQGFTDEYFNRAAEVNSNTQLYKQAGNSVTVPVIEVIANKL